MKLYIAVHDDVPDFMVPTLVAHSMLGAHLEMSKVELGVFAQTYYDEWLHTSFKKCVVRVNEKEFTKISEIPGTYLGHENTTMEGEKSCAIPIPVPNDQLPNVLKFAKLWKPRDTISAQWSAFDKVLHWINTQEEKMISKGDLYDAVMELRPI